MWTGRGAVNAQQGIPSDDGVLYGGFDKIPLEVLHAWGLPPSELGKPYDPCCLCTCWSPPAPYLASAYCHYHRPGPGPGPWEAGCMIDQAGCPVTVLYVVQ